MMMGDNYQLFFLCLTLEYKVVYQHPSAAQSIKLQYNVYNFSFTPSNSYSSGNISINK